MKTAVADWFDVFQGDAKSFEVTPTVAGTHSFRVSAGNRAGKSQPSETVSVSVPSIKAPTTAPTKVKTLFCVVFKRNRQLRLPKRSPILRQRRRLPILHK